MFRRLFLVLIFALLASFSAGRPAQAYYNPGTAAGFVNDYANVFTAPEKAALETKLSQFDASSSNEIAVVTINSLQGDTIENFANKLFTDWQIGKAKQDNGVLILIAIDDRKMRIEPGYGLEGALPDAVDYQIINNTMKPAFQAKKYYDGVDKATDEIIAATKGEYKPEAPAAPAVAGVLKNLNADGVLWIVFAIFYALSALGRYLAKSKSWWQGGVIGVIFGFILSFFFLGLTLIILPVFFGAIGLIFDYLVSLVLPQPSKTGRRGGPWFWGGFGGSGFGGGSGGGGGGFGGFGGGSSGGGGASGSW